MYCTESATKIDAVLTSTNQASFGTPSGTALEPGDAGSGRAAAFPARHERHLERLVRHGTGVRRIIGSPSDLKKSDSYRALVESMREHGVNVTALMEALGSTLAEHALTPEAKLPPTLKGAVSQARTIASSRSSRRRD